MSAHTPGPWFAKGPFVSDGKGMHIAQARVTYPRDVRDENARLLAAAPELLAGLKHAVARLDAYEHEADSNGDLRTAIAKAEGGR